MLNGPPASRGSLYIVARAVGKPVDAMCSCADTQRFGLNHFGGINSNGLHREVRLTVSNVDGTYVTWDSIYCDGILHISPQESINPDPSSTGAN